MIDKIEDSSTKKKITIGMDKLGRGPTATNLSKFLKVCIKQNFVMSLNSGYGTGKTFFLKMLESELIERNVRVIYFNAWENDDINPFNAFMGEIYKNFKNNDAFADLKKVASKTYRYVAATGLQLMGKALLKKFTGADEQDIEILTDLTKDVFDKELERYEEEQKSKEELKEALREFKNKVSPSDNVVIIVDDLDRCKPTYSIELLETVKHYYGVDGYTFILSADYEQLNETVKAVYGNIDSGNYLRKFIDMQFTLPVIDSLDYIYKLIEHYFSDNTEEHISFSKYLAYALEHYNLTLRDIEKVLLNYKAFTLLSRVRILKSEDEGIIALVTILIIIKIKDNKAYNELISENCINIVKYVKKETIVIQETIGEDAAKRLERYLRICPPQNNNDTISDIINQGLGGATMSVILRALDFMGKIG